MARKNMHRYAAVAAVTLGLATFAQNASAQLTDTATGNASVTVDNTLSITETTPMNFATVAAVADAGQTATLVVDTAGALTPTSAGNAVFYVDSTTTPSQGVFDVTGPNGATVSVILPSAPVTVTCATGIDFTLDTFVDDTGGGTVSTLGGATPVPVNVGATLKTDSTVLATTGYDTQTCTGTYTMTISL